MTIDYCEKLSHKKTKKKKKNITNKLRKRITWKECS